MFSLMFVDALAKTLQEKKKKTLPVTDLYLSSAGNYSITHTYPDRKLGILCMKYFSQLGCVNKPRNEAGLSSKWCYLKNGEITVIDPVEP